jgi:hypothetical protein
MPTNNYFNNYSFRPQQNVVEDLVAECIQVTGMDFLYLPRTMVATDGVLGDVKQTLFDNAFELEMYVESVDGWSAENVMISKFGLDIKDTAKLVVSRRRFAEVVQDQDFPKEGDLIYMPLTDAVLVVKYVDHENPFYQFGKLYTFTLTVEMFQFNQEEFNTGVEAVDRIETDHAYQVTLDLLASGGTGDFHLDEMVYQEINGKTTASGAVASWDKAKSVLTVKNVTGKWEDSTESTDSTKRYIQSYINPTLKWEIKDAHGRFPSDPFADNELIETQANEILDFDESNPLGETNVN